MTGGGGGTGGGTGGGGGTVGGGTTTAGCFGLVECYKAAMSEAEGMACDMKASMQDLQLIDAVYECSGNHCAGMSGAAAPASSTSRVSPRTSTAPPHSTTRAARPAIVASVLNGTAKLYGAQCQQTDAACNACTTQTNACLNDKS
jgi:hypothetical protein